MIQFATKDTIIQPKGGVIIEIPQEQDHMLGAIEGAGIAGPDFDLLVSDGQWGPYAPQSELQRDRFGDTFMCVSFSNINIKEFILSKRYADLTSLSKIFLGVISGTTRGQGNGKRNVAEACRLNGFVPEMVYPYTQDMTLDQVYAAIPPAIIAQAASALNQYTMLWKWLSDNKPTTLMAALPYSPIQVDVSGSYTMNDKGYVVWDQDHPVYAHEVAIFGYELNECWYVFDSEAGQFIKFAWNYPFGSPMIHSVKKKMKIQLIQKIGQAGIAVKHCSENSLIAFSGGAVEGGDLFKSIFGVPDFKQIPITQVTEWPYPIKYLITTSLGGS